jgi:hypothetical protein
MGEIVSSLIYERKKKLMKLYVLMASHLLKFDEVHQTPWEVFLLQTPIVS